MSQLSKRDLSFVEDLPKHVEIECPVCLNILTDPHLVSCCGHNFCGFCIERVKASDGSCPMCKDSVIADDSYLLLPIEIRKESETFHFYTSKCGQHMSARVMSGNVTKKDGDYFIFLAFHEGKFDKFQPKLPKIFAKLYDKDTPLIEDTEATYEQSPPGILNGISRWNDTVPGGVIRVKINAGIYILFVLTITIYTKE